MEVFMVGLIVTIVSYVLLGLVAGIAFWVGFKRGVKRSLIVTGVSLGLLIVAYFVTPFISKAILGIQISSGGSAKPLSQIIIDAVSSSDAMKTAIENSHSFKAFLEALPSVVINVAVFLVMFGIVRLFGYIIYKIIEKTTLKSKKEEKELGIKRNKWAGAGINTAKALVFTFIALAPVTALLGFVDDIQNETKSEYSESSSAETSLRMQTLATNSNQLPTIESLFDTLPSFAKEGISAYNNNILGAVGGFLGIDNLIFDGLTKISVDGENIYFRRDALEYVTLYNTFVDVSKALESSSSLTIFKNINWDAIDKSFEKILNSGLVKGLGANVAADVIKNYDQFTFVNLGEYEDILEAIKASIENVNVKEYFTNDFKQIYSAVSAAGRSGLLDDVYQNKEEIKEILKALISAENKETVLQIFDSVLNMNIVKNATTPVVEFVLEKIDQDEISLAENATTNWQTFKTDVNTIVENAIDLNSVVDLTTIAEDPLSLMNINLDKIDKVASDTGSLLDKVDRLLKYGDGSAVNKLLEKFEIENILSVKKENGQADTTITNFKSLFENVLALPLKNARVLDLYEQVSDEININTLLTSIAQKLASDSNAATGYSKILENIVLPLYRVDGLRTKVFDKIKEGASGSDFINFNALDKKDSSGNLIFDQSYSNWKNDIENLTAILVEFYNTKVGPVGSQKNLIEKIITDGADFSETIKELSSGSLEKIIMPIMYTLSTRDILQDALSEIASNLDTILGTSGTTLNLASVTLKKGEKEDQASEICSIITTIIDLFGAEGAESMENIDYAKLGRLLDVIKENACRIPLSPTENKKTELGLFTTLFDNLYNKLLATYPKAEDIIGDKPVYEINFTKLMKVVQDFKDAEADADSFIGKLSTIVSTDEGVSKDAVEELINSIDTETIEEELETIENLIDVIEELEINVIPEETATIIEANKDEILETINNNTEIPDTLKDKIKNLLGLTENAEE